MQGASLFPPVGRLRERGRGDVSPDFVPRHSVTVSSKVKIDDKLPSIPLERPVVVGIHVAGGWAGVVGQQSLESLRALVLPMQGENEQVLTPRA